MTIPIYPIVTYPDPGLARPTKPVSAFDHALERIIKRMVPTMRHAEGVGLAANQVGLQLSLATVEHLPAGRQENRGTKKERVALHAIVNPVILDASDEREEMMEGCLSCPGIEVKVARSVTITVRYHSPNGTLVERTIDGFEARIYQHEIDHLHGLTILDRAHGQRALIDAYRANPGRFQRQNSES